MYKTLQINCFRKGFCVTAFPCVSGSSPLTYVWAFGFVGCILFAGQNVSRKMDGEACPAGGPGRSRLYPDHSRIGPAVELTVRASFSQFQLSKIEGSLARTLLFHTFNFQILRELSHESFVWTSSTFTSSIFRFWGNSRTKASFSHLPFSDFEGCLARKLRFHIVYFPFWKELSHESFVFTSSTFRFWSKSSTKFTLLKVSGCTTCCVLLDKTCPGRWGSLSGERVPDGLTVQSSFSQFQLANIEGSLARKLRFHIFNFQILKDVSHESIVFPSSTFTFGKCLARKLRFHIFHFRFWREVSHESFVFAASTFRFSHLPPSLLEEGLARKLRFHIFHFQILQEVSHEMRFWNFVDARHAVFCRTKRVLEDGWGSVSGGRVPDGLGCTGIILGTDGSGVNFTISTFKNWRKSRRKASFSHLQLSDFEEVLLFHFHFLRDVSHESFVFTSSAFRFWSKSSTKFTLLKVSECTTCCVLLDKTCPGRWGSLSCRRVPDGPGYVRIMVGWAPQWNWHFRHHLANVPAPSSIVLRNRSQWNGRFRRCFADILARCSFSISQVSLCRSHRNGRVKVACWCRCVRNIIVFCSWAS